jgi:hypothetical protein
MDENELLELLNISRDISFNEGLYTYLLEIIDTEITDSIISLAYAANNIQIDFDSFLARHGLELLEDDLENLLFGEISSVPKSSLEKFRRIIYDTLKSGINDARMNAMLKPLGKLTDMKYKWILDKSVKNCPDCIRRSQYPARTLAQWTAIGKPGSGITVCRQNCYCTLIPEVNLKSIASITK